MKIYTLKKLLTLIILVVSTGAIVIAQNYTYSENAQNDGFKIQTNSKGNVVIQHAIHQFQLNDIQIEGESMKKINYGLSLLPSQEGAPDVPGLGRYILIPNGADVQINIINEEIETYSNIELSPAAAIPFETEDDIPAVKGNVYQEDAFFPSIAYQSETTEVRGMTMAMININPFQYNPVTKELKVYKNVEIECEIIGGNSQYGQNRFRSKYWDQILSDLVLNTQDIPKVDYAKFAIEGKDLGCEYLIIVPNNADYLTWADSIKLFRTEQGIDTKIVTTDEFGGNTLENIKDFMNTVYETWDPVPAGVLLMADYGNDENTITSKEYPHPYSGTYITDNYYADYTGNDLPDFVFARITGRNYEEFEIMVKKFIDYERTPPTVASFYNNPITALGWQTERWFQICSESVGGYMANVLNKEPVRINAVYGGNPNSDPWSTATNTAQVINYFGPAGQGYIPATPSELGNWSGGSATDVVNAINNGAFILQHRDHGFEGGWGEPDFGMSHISQLNNVDKLSHIFSINCLTGRFDVGGECFAEKFHRFDNGGALSLTAASQVSYSFVNDAYVWGMFDNMWADFLPDYGNEMIEEREFLPAFGNASGKYFLSYTNWPYNTDNKQITYRLFHHHGDAFNVVYTEVPQDMTIDYADVAISGPDYIEVQADEGAMIAFSVDGELIGVGEGTGSAAPITHIAQIPGTMIKVVITKQNFFRHEGYIQVIAPDGPYIVKSSFEINDPEGNNNNLVDFGEDISLDFSIKNLGTEIAQNVVVTISCENEYVTLADNEDTFGDVGVGEEITHENAFSFSIADSIPDNHNIVFDFTATNDVDVWESSFSMKAYAPVLAVLNMDIIEVDGNGNGRLDAGEDAIITIELTNNGHCDAPEGFANLISESEFITINEGSFSFVTIESDSIIIAEYSITANDDVPTGSIVSLTNELSAALYASSKDFYFSIGLIVEDWETGDFSQYDWANSGSADWAIDETEQYEGENSVKSGTISNSQETSLVLNYDVMVDDQISFFYKVSSESGWDKLKFYIDNSEMGSWSGEVPWTEAVFPVTAGAHVLKWEYSKDGSVSNGDDCAWVDFIVFPPMLLPTANAGDDAEVCYTDTEFQTNATAADYTNIMWTTSGNGTFSDSEVLDPIYTIGSDDLNNGTVQLTMTASGANGNATNSMMLYVVSDPLLPATPQGDANVCYAAQEIVYTIEDGNDQYMWYITPVDAGNIDVIANNAYISFNNGFSGEVSINAKAYNTCGEGPVSETFVLTVAEQSEATFVEDTETCLGSDATLNIELVGQGPWTVELMDENGAEIFFEADSSPFELTVSPEETMTYTLMHIEDANNCVGFADGSAIVTVLELPTASLMADDAEVCTGENVEVNLELTGTAPWNISIGDGANEEQSYTINEANEVIAFVSPNHSMDLQIMTLNDDNGCIGTGEGTAAISVKATPEVDLGIDTTICHNHIYTLDAQNEGGTYDWSTGADTRVIEVDQTMADANNDAIISVEVFGTTGCSNTDEVIVHFKDCTGIDELSEANIELMPNPNNGRFILGLPTYNSVVQVNIHNSIGESVYNIPLNQIQEQSEIDLSHLSDGVYFLIITTSEKQINKRFVIRK